jgi:hypothetical protein
VRKRRKPACGRTGSRLPRRAPELLPRNSPRGVRQGCRTSAEGQEPLLSTLDKSEERRIQAATGVVSFGYFSLDKQRKVSRRRGRDPDSNKPSLKRHNANGSGVNCYKILSWFPISRLGTQSTKLSFARRKAELSKPNSQAGAWELANLPKWPI